MKFVILLFLVCLICYVENTNTKTKALSKIKSKAKDLDQFNDFFDGLFMAMPTVPKSFKKPENKNRFKEINSREEIINETVENHFPRRFENKRNFPTRENFNQNNLPFYNTHKTTIYDYENDEENQENIKRTISRNYGSPTSYKIHHKKTNFDENQYHSKKPLQNSEDFDLPPNTFFLEKVPKNKLTALEINNLKKLSRNFLEKKMRDISDKTVESSNDSENKSEIQSGQEKKEDSQSEDKETEKSNNLGPRPLPSKIVLPKKNSIRIILEDWLKISSPSFRDYIKYPPINMPNGKELTFKLDNNDFRINDSFDENNADPILPPEKQFFWFRLSGRNIFYSLTKTDINIQGAISLKTLAGASHYSDFSADALCIKLEDLENHQWKICAESMDIRNKWYCTIMEILNQNDPICEKVEENKPTVIEHTVTQPVVLIPLPTRHCNDDWNYEMMGADWECECSEGREQSPINLPPPDKAISSNVKPIFEYSEAMVKLSYSTADGLIKKDENLKIRYVDNCLRIFHKFFGKIVTLDGAIYNAEEIVFHTPSEHTIDGKHFAMEMQVIHYGQTKGDIAKQIVLSFLFERKPGVFNKFIDDIDFFNLPNPVTKDSELKTNLFLPKIFYTADNDEIPIMRPFSFYTYQGSLSFPPCSERTIVYVASQPLPLSTSAIQMFQEALRIPDIQAENGDVITSNRSNVNARKLQNLNGRPVFFYDHIKYCGPDPVPVKPKEVGHYEKIEKATTEYFYVAGDKTSGLPGAYVVPKEEALAKETPQ